MFNLFTKSSLALLAVCSSLMAWDCCDPCDACDNNRAYIGGFGGGLYSDSTKITQMGTAFFTEAQGGPLAVNAQGKTRKTSSGFGGVQVGYEWSNPCATFGLGKALEIEGFWYGHKKQGDLINPTTRLDEHDFLDTFHMDMGVCLVNAVISLNNFSFASLTPYVGGGIGAAHLDITKADSLQVDPPELDINHFNSRRNDSSWAFAAQAKAGVRYNICNSFHIFGEYRYLYIDCSNFILGSTDYPNHAATSPWNVKINNIHYNAFVIGLQYDL